MALFPQMGPVYYDSSDRDVLSRMEAFYSQSLSINQSYWAEAEIDVRFESGDQALWNEIYGNIPLAQRRMFMFNRLKRIKNMMSGHQRKNRKSTVVVPVENGDQETADQFSKVLDWVNRNDNVLDTISDAFEGALITGMNLLQIWTDYRSDPISGNIRVDNCSYNSFLIDPFFRKKDLSDCNGIWKRSFLTKSECISLLPDQKKFILSLNSYGTLDNKFQYMPENFNYAPSNLLTYDEFYYRDYRTQKMLVDSQTGKTIEWNGTDDEALRLFVQMYPQVKEVEQTIPTVRLAIVVQGTVVYDGPNPLGIDEYPFVPVIAYYSPDIPYFNLRIQGVIRSLRDAQFLYNRRKAIELDILESQTNSGFIYKKSALVDPKSVFLSGQGRGIALKDEADIGTSIQKIPPASLDASVIQISEILAREIQEIAGISDELLGMAEDEKAGVLSMLRQGAALTTLQKLYDQLDNSQKLLGKLMIKIVQNNFTPGKIERIIEEEPQPQFYNKAFGIYDAAVEEGVNTTTQKQREFAQLIEMRNMGIAIPDTVIIKAATIQNKKDLLEEMAQQQEQQQQLQIQQMQTQMQLTAAQTELAQARAIADRGLGIERASRVAENEAFATERYAQAQKDNAIADMNVVKAMKEIEEVDLSQLERLVALSRTIASEAARAEDVYKEKKKTSAVRGL